MMRFDGKALARIRKRRGYTQQQLGVRMGLREDNGQQTVSTWESGIRVPLANMLPRMAAALDVGMHEFFSWQDTEQDTEQVSRDQQRLTA